MRRIHLTPVLLLLCVGMPAFAAGELLVLRGGEEIVVMHPGVDGVDHPKALTSYNHSPGYPRDALELGEDSQVTVAVLVRKDGTVGEAHLVDVRHPDYGFDEAALRTVRGWRFRPAKQGGQKVNSYTFVRFNFVKPEDSFVRATLASEHDDEDTPTRPGFGTAAVGRSYAVPTYGGGGHDRYVPTQFGGIEHVFRPGAGLYFRGNPSGNRPVTALRSGRVTRMVVKPK